MRGKPTVRDLDFLREFAAELPARGTKFSCCPKCGSRAKPATEAVRHWQTHKLMVTARCLECQHEGSPATFTT